MLYCAVTQYLLVHSHEIKMYADLHDAGFNKSLREEKHSSFPLMRDLFLNASEMSHMVSSLSVGYTLGCSPVP